MNNIEYRVYYDETGKVITYTIENIPGKYLVITREQYAEARPDAMVRDGKLIKTNVVTHIWKLEKSSQGTQCSKYDISIIVDHEGDFWEMKPYEIK